MRNKIRSILHEAVDNTIISQTSYSTITSAIAEYGHLLNGRKGTLGELATAIQNSTYHTEKLEMVVNTLNKYRDSYIENLVPNNKAGNNLFYRKYITLPPEYKDFGQVMTGGTPPQSGTV